MTSPNSYPTSHEQELAPKPIDVGMKTWEATTAESPVVQTKGLGPCIGIAVYDAVKREGRMAHIAVPMLEQQTIADFLGSPVESPADTQNLQVWVRGGQPNLRDEGAKMFSLMGRDVIANSLAAAGISPDQMDVAWDDEPMGSRSTRMILDAQTGQFESLVSPRPEVAVEIGREAIAGASPAIFELAA